MGEQRKFDNFDEFADEYRDIHNNAIKLSGTDSDYFSEYKIVELKKHENAEVKLSLLDFGCGDGNSCVYFSKHFSNIEINGIDVSEDSIKIAQERQIANASFKAFDGGNIPYEDNAFDIVFTSMVFHHIAHNLHDNILSEIRRVLKPKGRFYIFEHNPNNPLTRKVVRECVFDKDAVLLKPNYCQSIITNAGFSKNEINYTIFIPRHKALNWMLGAENFLKWLPLGAQYYVKSIK